MNVNKDIIPHKQSQAFRLSFMDCEECILRRRGKSLVKLCKNYVPIYTLARECQLLWETDGTNFNSHGLPLIDTK